jgi:hypothetical protein
MAFQKAGGLLGGGKYGVEGGKIGPALPNQGGPTSAASGGAMGGFASAAKIAAVGVAAVGIGYGFKMAAEGAASLSESISKLTGPQLGALQNMLKTIGSTMLIGLAAGILAVGVAGQTGAIGLLAVGGAALMLGAGIGLAAMGVGKMAEGFGTLDKVDLSKVGSGLSSIALASLALANPLSMLGLSSIEESLEDITKLNFNNVIPLQNLHFVDKDIQNMKDMANLLVQINAIDTSKLNALKNLFSEGTMKVQIAGNSMIRNEITLDIEGEKIFKRIEKMVELKTRKAPGDTKSIKV